MSTSIRRRNPGSLVMIAFSLVLLCGCVNIGNLFSAEWTCNCDEQLCTQYKAAVAVTALPLTPEKIYRKLTPITAANDALIWEDDVVGSRLLVAIYSWGLNPDPGDLPNPNYTLITNKWVTIVPDLYDFFKTRAYTDTRLEQALGLPPCYGNTKIIEMYVSPADMFRPSPDPETTDQEASIEFPWRTSRIVTYNTNTKIYDDFCSTPAPCYSDYETWFNNRRAGVYVASPPYPWTGLGYTYDWGYSPNHIGLSEFVVVPTITGVLRISDAADYFRSHKETLSVTKTGEGTITSRPYGIGCGSNCSRTFGRYSRVTLTVKASASSRFEGWGGACAHAGTNPTCTVTMTNRKSVEANFASQ